MVKSMTGFGRGENTGKHKVVTAEIKSVNHRYSEVLVRMPRQYNLMEETIRRFVLEGVSRGRVEVYLKLEDAGFSKNQVQVDKELALAYYKAMKELAAITGTELTAGAFELAQLPNVLKIEENEEDLEEVWQDVKPALRQALHILVQMRETEGEKLAADLRERLRYLQKLHNEIEDSSVNMVSLYREKLKSRIAEILDNGQIDENRLALEVALFADKSSITEELVRLKSHFQQFGQTLQDNQPVGRKLDFLLQEMHREVNTIASKTSDLSITQHVVEMKSELEKLREQVQNIE